MIGVTVLSVLAIQVHHFHTSVVLDNVTEFTLLSLMRTVTVKPHYAPFCTITVFTALWVLIMLPSLMLFVVKNTNMLMVVCVVF